MNRLQFFSRTPRVTSLDFGALQYGQRSGVPAVLVGGAEVGGSAIKNWLDNFPQLTVQCTDLQDEVAVLVAAGTAQICKVWVGWNGLEGLSFSC